jgi:hypothetical protein
MRLVLISAAAAAALAPVARAQRGASADTQLAATPSAHPEPRHSPEQVIGFQLAALRDNDVPTADAGIALAFSFSSPANRVVTGPLANFAALVKSAAYRPLLRHVRAARGPLRLVGDQAEQQVTVTTPAGDQAAYLFTLTRQRGDAPYAGCWMTDGVLRLRAVELPAAVRRVAMAGPR